MTMGKKSRNRSAKAVRGEGICSHAGSAVPALKKALIKDHDFTACKACRIENKVPSDDAAEQQQQQELFICLRCCCVACRRHTGTHFRAPRSDIHCHFLSTTSGIAHCVACDFKALDEEENHVIQSSINFLMQSLKRNKQTLQCIENNQEEDWRAKAMKRVQSEKIEDNDGESKVKTEKKNGKCGDTPLGLVNLGSTCYMNSSLQSLAACRNVRFCFDNFCREAITVSLNLQEGDEAVEVTFQHQDGALPERLAEVLRRVRPFEPEWRNSPICDFTRPMRSRLIGLKGEFTQRYPQFSNDWAEQDAHEFLRHFIDLVSENSRKRGVEACKEKLAASMKWRSSVIEGIFKSTLLCVKHCDNCEHYSTNMEHALDLCVALDKEVGTNNSSVRVTGAGTEVKQRAAVPLSKHKLKKAKKEKKRHKKGRSIVDRSSSGSHAAAGPEAGNKSDDCDGGDEDEGEERTGREMPVCPASGDPDCTIEVEELFGIDSPSRKEESKAEPSLPLSDDGKPMGDFSFPSISKDSSVDVNVSSSEDDTNYDIFADSSVPAYNSEVEEVDSKAVTQPLCDDSFLTSWTTRRGLGDSDEETVASRYSKLSSGFLDGKCPVYSQSAKAAEPTWDEDKQSAALIERMLLEDMERLEGNEDFVAPLFSDVSMDTCIQPLFHDVETSSSTQAELHVSGNQTPDHISVQSEPQEVEGDAKPLPEREDKENGESSETERSSSAGEPQEPEKDLDADDARLAEQTLRPSSSSTGLEALLEKYFERSLLEDFKCPKCNKRGFTSRRQVMLELPPVLMVSVKRFRGFVGQTRKIAVAVDFPVDLDLSSFTSRVTPSLCGDSSRRYRLRAVIQHQGSARSGHYVAYVSICRGGKKGCGDESRLLSVRRAVTVDELIAACQSHAEVEEETLAVEAPRSEEVDEGEEWFLVSDTSVTPVSLRQVLGAQAYILFYERV